MTNGNGNTSHLTPVLEHVHTRSVAAIAHEQVARLLDLPGMRVTDVEIINIDTNDPSIQILGQRFKVLYPEQNIHGVPDEADLRAKLSARAFLEEQIKQLNATDYISVKFMAGAPYLVATINSSNWNDTKRIHLADVHDRQRQTECLKMHNDWYQLARNIAIQIDDLLRRVGERSPLGFSLSREDKSLKVDLHGYWQTMKLSTDQATLDGLRLLNQFLDTVQEARDFARSRIPWWQPWKRFRLVRL